MYLMHKNDIVAKIETYNEKPCSVIEIYIPDKMPIGLKGDIDLADRNLMLWHHHRSIPDGRVNIESLKRALNIDRELDRLSTRSLGLSLTDSYWYKAEESKITWEDVNLYDHKFISDILLSKQGQLEKQHISPDYTTDGMLEKFWIDIEGRPFLIKSGHIPGATENGILAANEIVASKIAAAIGSEHVEYQKINIRNDRTKYCVCKSFGNKNEDFVPAENIRLQLDTYDRMNVYRYMCDLGFKDDMNKMMVFDILIHNIDRHCGNFGILVNSDTMEVKRFAPLFDSGSCLNYIDSEPGAGIMKPFEMTPKEMLQMIDSKVELPDKKYAIKVIKDVYESFGLEENAIERAQKEFLYGYELLENRFYELEHAPEQAIEDDIDYDLLFEESGFEP